MKKINECNICYENYNECCKCKRCTFLCCPECFNNFILLKKINVLLADIKNNLVYYISNGLLRFIFNLIK